MMLSGPASGRPLPSVRPGWGICCAPSVVSHSGRKSLWSAYTATSVMIMASATSGPCTRGWSRCALTPSSHIRTIARLAATSRSTRTGPCRARWSDDCSMAVAGRRSRAAMAACAAVSSSRSRASRKLTRPGEGCRGSLGGPVSWGTQKRRVGEPVMTRAGRPFCDGGPRTSPLEPFRCGGPASFPVTDGVTLGGEPAPRVVDVRSDGRTAGRPSARDELATP